jgi:protein Cut8
MNSVLPTNPNLAPHLFSRRISPSRSRTLPWSPEATDQRLTADATETPPNSLMHNRKRKADDDGNDGDTMMTRSPSASPSIQPGVLPSNQSRTLKRARTTAAGRPLELPRLLETLSADELRTLLKTVCDRHPQLANEVSNVAPRPSAETVLNLLGQYEARMLSSLPFGNRPKSEYAFNRVRQSLVDLLNALQDYTHNFLPPRETQISVSLNFLDQATEIIHRLPNWDNYQNNRHKQEAYDEISVAWAIVIKEAAKRAGGFQLRVGGWDEKLAKHHERSGGRFGAAMAAMSGSLSWMSDDAANSTSSQHNHQQQQQQQQQQSIREQLLSGTFGSGMRTRMGPWDRGT